MENKLTVSLSPHIHSGMDVDRIMWNVVLALMPALAVAVWTFGLPALWVVLLAVGSCLATEWIIDRWVFRVPQTLTNGSAVITGLLLGFNLPSILPWWMVIIGGIVAIGIGKMSFGGLGCNIWNPALVGRVFLLLSFPAAMTTWPTGVGSGIDGVTGATFLTTLNEGGAEALREANLMDMAVGHMNGSLGEVGSIALLIGFGWIWLKGIVSWHIPVATLGGAALLSWLLGGNPLLDLLSGGLMLGALFMATDFVTSPMTRPGQLLFGFLIGIITIIIRRFGSYPEGVSFAILLMNSFVPLINRYMRPRVFGERRGRK
ncbi:MAG: RnfABCDGE type electron transport complex subunit D [Bacteroides sp.]|nr:RnfABCDGE type electron transport complex subunit D [Bacteroides sp.]